MGCSMCLAFFIISVNLQDSQPQILIHTFMGWGSLGMRQTNPGMRRAGLRGLGVGWIHIGYV